MPKEKTATIKLPKPIYRVYAMLRSYMVIVQYRTYLRSGLHDGKPKFVIIEFAHDLAVTAFNVSKYRWLPKQMSWKDLKD